MPPREHREGDVRISKKGRNRIEIYARSRTGDLAWMPYWQHVREQLVACCPTCGHSGRMSEFEASPDRLSQFTLGGAATDEEE